MIKVYYDPILGCTGWEFKKPSEATDVKKIKKQNIKKEEKMIHVSKKTITFKRANGLRVTKDYLLEISELPTGDVVTEKLADFIMDELRDSYKGIITGGQFIWIRNLNKYLLKK